MWVTCISFQKKNQLSSDSIVHFCSDSLTLGARWVFHTELNSRGISLTVLRIAELCPDKKRNRLSTFGARRNTKCLISHHRWGKFWKIVPKCCSLIFFISNVSCFRATHYSKVTPHFLLCLVLTREVVALGKYWCPPPHYHHSVIATLPLQSQSYDWQVLLLTLNLWPWFYIYHIFILHFTCVQT